MSMSSVGTSPTFGSARPSRCKTLTPIYKATVQAVLLWIRVMVADINDREKASKPPLKMHDTFLENVYMTRAE
jgi:hypothetical protein